MQERERRGLPLVAPRQIEKGAQPGGESAIGSYASNRFSRRSSAWFSRRSACTSSSNSRASATPSQLISRSRRKRVARAISASTASSNCHSLACLSWGSIIPRLTMSMRSCSDICTRWQMSLLHTVILN